MINNFKLSDKRLDLRKREQDKFTIHSHTLASEAVKNGKFIDAVPVLKDGKKPETIKKDNGFRVSINEKLSKLTPKFTKPHGAAADF